MQVEIPYIDYSGFQDKLNTILGDNTVTLILGEDTSQQKFYLQWSDSTPQVKVDEAIALANDNAKDILNRTKVRICDDFNSIAKKVVDRKSPPAYTAAELAAVEAWVQDQTTPVPLQVAYLSLAKDCSNLEAANAILASQAEYDAFIAQVESIKTAGQTATIAAPDYYTCKTTATTYIDQLKNLL